MTNNKWHPTQAEAEEMWDDIAARVDPREATIIRAFKSGLVDKLMKEGLKKAEATEKLPSSRNRQDWANDIFELPIFHDENSPHKDRAWRAAEALMSGGRFNKMDIMRLRLLLKVCLKYGTDDEA